MATVFINVTPEALPRLKAEVEALQAAGFGVFARPKTDAADDVDGAMGRYLKTEVASGTVAEVIVASHDQAAFSALLQGFSAQGINSAVLGFRECATWVDAVASVSLIDLESIEGCARKRPMTLETLPPDGALLRPTRPLASKAPQPGTQCPAVALLLQAVEELARECEGGWVRKAAVHPRMQRLQPSFTMQQYGYPKLSSLLAACGGAVKTRQGKHDHELALT